MKENIFVARESQCRHLPPWSFPLEGLIYLFDLIQDYLKINLVLIFVYEQEKSLYYS